MEVGQLVRALESLEAVMPDYELWVCRYGMKMNAECFYNNVLAPAYTKIAQQQGNEISYS